MTCQEGRLLEYPQTLCITDILACLRAVTDKIVFKMLKRTASSPFSFQREMKERENRPYVKNGSYCT